MVTGKKVDTRPEEVEGALRMVGRTTIGKAPALKGT
jgi:hypothetical protein